MKKFRKIKINKKLAKFDNFEISAIFLFTNTANFYIANCEQYYILKQLL